MLLVNVARGTEQLETLRFEAVNPTFLLTVGKPRGSGRVSRTAVREPRRRQHFQHIAVVKPRMPIPPFDSPGVYGKFVRT